MCRRDLSDLDISLSPGNAPSIEFLVDVRNGAGRKGKRREEREEGQTPGFIVGPLSLELTSEESCFLTDTSRSRYIARRNWISGNYSNAFRPTL